MYIHTPTKEKNWFMRVKILVIIFFAFEFESFLNKIEENYKLQFTLDHGLSNLQSIVDT